MPDCISQSVAHRFLVTVKNATIVYRDRDGVAWGWLSSNMPRLHLVQVNNESRASNRVWLEDGAGCRSFIPEFEPSCDADLGALHQWVSRTRNAVELAWLRTCQRKRWLDYSPQDEVITIYGGTPRELRRHVRRVVLVSEFIKIEVNTNSASLEVPLNRLIWRGADDGSDAEPA